MTAVFDSHCHIDDPRFDADRPEVLARAEAAGIDHLVVPGVSASTWHRTRRVCAHDARLHATFGLHPYFIAQHGREDVEALRDWVRVEKPVAVGECGLDYYLPERDLRAQRNVFEQQLEIAAEFGLPVIVHARRAVDDVIAALKRHPGLRADIHSFAGSEVQARRLVDMGAMLGIGASVQFDRAQRLRRIVTDLPLSSLLVETDAPDQPGPDRRGQRNEPLFVAKVVACIADLRGISWDAVAEQTRSNALELFAIHA
ncbi:MAG: TatD family hydrolase [Gammaproteobacteria bacterium]|nr:TatD family hydrolase [Gammaproteobacteria bacterium]